VLIVSIKKLFEIIKLLEGLLHKPTRAKVAEPFVLKLFGFSILTRNQLVNDVKNKIIWFGSEETFSAGKPYVSGEIPKDIKSEIGSFVVSQPFVSDIPNAELIGSVAIGFDANGKVISETTLPPYSDLSPRFEGGLPIQSLLLKKLPFNQTVQLDTVCLLLNYWSKNYYHWIVDCLTRIEGLELYEKRTGRKPLLIIDANPTSWQVESLQILGYNFNDCIHWTFSKAAVKRLIVPSFRRQGEAISPKSLIWIREQALDKLTNIKNCRCDFSPRIYISRAKASGRRVINEQQVLSFLLPLGFVSYSLEDLSFSEQVKLFSTAEVIIGPHGAGFTNIIFSPHKLIFIEFVTKWSSAGFFTLSSILGYQYNCLQCHQTYLQNFRQTRGDMLVDIEKLRNLLGKLL